MIFMMNKYDLNTGLNIRVLYIVLVFVFVTGINQWLSLQENKHEYSTQLETITKFIAEKMPDSSFVEIADRKGTAEKSIEQQVMAINEEIQPILNDLLVPTKAIKYGVYSRYHKRIIAVGPDFDSSILVIVPPRSYEDLYLANTERFGELKNSVVWYGAPVLYHDRPISNNGRIIGHVFACINLDIIYTAFWNKALKTLLGGFIALLVAIVLLQEALIRLKRDLGLFAEAIIKGSAKSFESKIPELTPVLQHISEQTENMARLDRLNLIGEMAASIGHEVRNPMTTVRGFLQHLGVKEEFNGAKEYFSLMIEELDRANMIITEFLSLAKNRVMDFKVNNLNKVFMEVTPLIQADALRYGCQVEIKLGNIPSFCIDENSIRQLILNMVRNAIEAMPNGGIITIGTTYHEDKVFLSISDQGVGIPIAMLAKLGTPFATTKENGVGLGLAVCYRIVERHDASMTVESELGRGTTFTIKFNCKENTG